MKRTLYDVLQLSHTAERDVIESAYTKLKAKHQSVHTPESDNELKFIQHAYETLINPEKRKSYDERLAEEDSFQRHTTTYTNSVSSKAWWESPVVATALFALLVIFGVKLYLGHSEEKEKIQINADSSTKHLDNEKTLVDGVVNNQSKAIDNSANTSNKILAAAQADAERRRLDADIQRQQAELNRQAALEDAKQRMEQQRQQREQQLNAQKAQQAVDKDRQTTFNKLVSEHRYREAKDFAKSPNEILFLDNLIQADNEDDVRRTQEYDRRIAIENYKRMQQ